MKPMACIHIRDFAAWLRLREKPEESEVGVHAEGRIVAVSPALRAAGLSMGEGLARARLLFPKASFYLRDVPGETAAWEEMLDLFWEFSPNLLSLSHGWVLLHPDSPAHVQLIVRSLSARGGIASRRFAAMLAALQSEKGEVKVLSETKAHAFIQRAPVRCLLELGLDEETVERLELFGLSTLGKVEKLTLRQLEAQFGLAGTRLHAWLHPSGPEPELPLFQPPPSLSAACRLEYPAREPRQLLPLLEALVRHAMGKLDGQRTQLLTLRVEDTAGHVRSARRVLRAPSGRFSLLFGQANALLWQLLAEPLAVERMAVELGALGTTPQNQRSLFERPALGQVVQSLNQRYPGRLLRGAVVDRHALFPEDALRLVAWSERKPA